MKWKAKHYPEPGETFVRYKFAFFPIQTTDEYWVWFERVKITYRRGFWDEMYGGPLNIVERIESMRIDDE